MHWFRSKRHLGARLALFALAVQLALSFGHIHRDQLIAPATASTLAALPGAVSPSVPAPAHQSDGSIDGLCAVCALIQLVHASVPAAAPTLTIPSGFQRTVLEAPFETVLTAAPRFLFQARAPPSA